MTKNISNKKNKEKGRSPREASEFDQRILDLARVTRVMAGGKRLRFRACVAIGDKKGKLGVGVGKGSDVSLAVTKAVNLAKKQMVTIPLTHETIPHRIQTKFGAAVLLLKPAPAGTGIKAGGVMKTMLDLAGVPNVVGKILGSKNKINNAFALVKALSSFLPQRKVIKKTIPNE